MPDFETEKDKTETEAAFKTAVWAQPFDLFGEWLKEAERQEINDPTGVALATVSKEGRPSQRMVLMKHWDEQGFVFYTNTGSRKASELAANSYCAMLFHWKSLRRQVRIEGQVERVTEAEADAYFASRARRSQIGAWASRQSVPMKGRFEFEREIARYTAKFGLKQVPRPEFWSGYRLKPDMFEFWNDKEYRLHDREVYKRMEQDGRAPYEGNLPAAPAEWCVHKLFP